MDFIALTLEEAETKAAQNKVNIILDYIDQVHSQAQDSVCIKKWRVVNEKHDNGVTKLYLMVEA